MAEARPGRWDDPGREASGRRHRPPEAGAPTGVRAKGLPRRDERPARADFVPPHGELILVRCPDQPVNAVRLHYTGVAVPNLLGRGDLGMNKPQTLLRATG